MSLPFDFTSPGSISAGAVPADGALSSEVLRLTQELDRARAQLQLLTDYTGDLVARHDLEGLILDVSPNSEQWFGYRPAEVIGQSGYAFVHPDDIRHVRERHDQVVAGQVFTEPVMCRILSRDGSYLWAELLLKEMDKPEDDLTRELISVTRNVTQRLEAERVSEMLRNKLAHVVRISSLGELASGLVHELVQPLTAITAFADGGLLHLDRRAVSRREVQQWLTEVSRLGRQAGGILRSMRDYLRVRPWTPSRVDLPRLIKDVVSLMQSTMRAEEIDVITDFGDSLPSPYVDHVQVQQVLLNLIRNAAESMASSSRRPRQLMISATLHSPEFVEVLVEDDGPGIPEELHPKLFRPFMSTKEGGVGLGLTISRSIIETHGGRLWFEPREQGAGFRFTLPLTTDLEPWTAAGVTQPEPQDGVPLSDVPLT